jgi:hypothetical protein
MKIYVVYYEPNSQNMAAFVSLELAKRYVDEVIAEHIREFCYIDELVLWQTLPN